MVLTPRGLVLLHAFSLCKECICVFPIVLVYSSLMETGKWCPLTKDVTIMARHFGGNESIPWGLELSGAGGNPAEFLIQKALPLFVT